MFLLLLGLILVVFAQSIHVFFVQDDFFLLSVSQTRELDDFLNFFIPHPEVVWYRPLSSQLFFYLGKIFFGLDPLPYHLIVMVIHSLTGLSLFKLVETITKNRQLAFLSVFYYTFHQIHVVSLSWLAAFSFVIGPLFLIWTLRYFSAQKYLKSYLVFILGLLSSEVMIVTIPIIIFTQWFEKRRRKYDRSLARLVPYIGVSLIIWWLRLVVFPTQQSAEFYEISYQQVVPLLKFYMLRILGVPLAIGAMSLELILVVLSLLGVYWGVLIWGTKVLWRKKVTHGKFFGVITLFGLSPFLLLPNHLAPHYLSFALIGGSSLFALVTSQFMKNKIVLVILLGSYLALQLIGSRWTYQTHWIFRRAELAKKLIETKQLVHPVGSEEYFALGANNAELLYK